MSAAGRSIGQNNIFEVLTGAAVVAVAVIFLAFAYMRTGSGSLSGYEVLARLPKVDGLGVGTDVRISGIKVGSVTDLALDPANFLVTVHMSIRNDIKLPTDSSLLITSSGVLGSQYLSITPGGDDKNIAAGGMIVNTQAANTNDLMNLAGRYLGSGSSPSTPSKPQEQPAAPLAQTQQPGPSP
jgi:phospholipid/cholesterol/gamma-HCH transport system substrate-binding protein